MPSYYHRFTVKEQARKTCASKPMPQAIIIISLAEEDAVTTKGHSLLRQKCSQKVQSLFMLFTSLLRSLFFPFGFGKKIFKAKSQRQKKKKKKKEN